MIAAFEALLLIVVIAVIVVLGFAIQESKRILKEDSVIAAFQPFELYRECKYNESAEFDHTPCAYNPDGFAIRRWPLVAPNSVRCVPRVDVVPCHQSKKTFGLTQLPRRVIKECAGYRSVAIQEVTPSEVILVPAVNNNVIMDRIVLASQIIIKCPRCIAVSRTISHPMIYSDAGAYCHVDVDTVELGWPESAATCDSKLVYATYDISRRCDFSVR